MRDATRLSLRSDNRGSSEHATAGGPVCWHQTRPRVHARFPLRDLPALSARATPVGTPVRGQPSELVDAVELAYSDAFRCAQRVRLPLHTNDEYYTDDEFLYLTLHIARLTRAERKA